MYSVVNTPSIINSPVLSFPGRNHGSQQGETQPAAWDLLLLLLLPLTPVDMGAQHGGNSRGGGARLGGRTRAGVPSRAAAARRLYV